MLELGGTTAVKSRVDEAFEHLIGLCGTEPNESTSAFVDRCIVASKFNNLSDLHGQLSVLSDASSVSDEALKARLGPYAKQLRATMEEAQEVAKWLAEILLAVED